jgi:hypothetical protein
MTRQDDGATYVFSVNMENKVAKARVSLSPSVKGRVSVLGEDRTLELSDGAFEDTFEGYGVHIYQIQRK